MLTDPARLDGDQQEQLAAILGRCPELEALAGHITAFAKILTHHAGDRLDGWLAAAEASPASPSSPPSPAASAATPRPSATP